MAASDAKPFPIKNTAYRVTFPILDADGDLVTGAAGLDSEVSKDAGTFADCDNEATEIATNSGVYYLDLTATEMNADTVAVIVKTSTSGAKTTVLVMYPVEDGDIPVNVTAIDDDTTAADNLESYCDGTTPIPANATQISGDSTAADNLEAACDGGTYNVGGGAVVAASVTAGVALADDAITSAKFDESTAFPLKSADTGATAVARTGADSDTLETLSDQIDTVSGYIDTEVAAIKAKTDLIPASPAAVGSAMTLTAAYDAAKTAAAAGAQMDLVNAPNATAVTAIQSGLATGAALSTVDTVVDAIKIVTDAIVTALELDGAVYRFTENALEEAPTGGGSSITVNDIFTGTIEGSINLQEALMLMLAFVAGEATGGGTTTVNFRNQASTKNRISYTVDEDGNRTAVTLDLT